MFPSTYSNFEFSWPIKARYFMFLRWKVAGKCRQSAGYRRQPAAILNPVSLSELFVLGFRCDPWIRKIFIRTFFSAMCSGKTVNIKKTIQCTLRYLSLVFFLGWKFWCKVFFLGLKFQACVFFWVCNMKLRRTPHHVYFEYPPWVFFVHVSVQNKHFSIQYS